MSVGWSGPDPIGFADGAGVTYELGTRYSAVNDVTINNVRVWGPPGGTARANRAGKIWSTGGALLATAAMPDTLPSGWSTYPLDSAVPLAAGSSVVVSYDIQNTYGAKVGGFAYPLTSSDGNVQAVERRLSDPTPDVFPPSLSGNTFYGVDIDYTAGIGGNQRPTVGISVTRDHLAVAATLTILDESPGTVTFAIEWGDGQQSVGLTSLGPHNHTYAAAGTYAILVTATDNGGLTDSAAAAVAVAPTYTGLTGTRMALADALSTVADVRGYDYRPAAPKTGDAWPLLGPLDRDEGNAFMVTWRVHVLLPQDERQASQWWDAHWAALYFALKPQAFVVRAEPITLPAAGGEQLAFEITLRAEE
jgi:hypothetical protein